MLPDLVQRKQLLRVTAVEKDSYNVCCFEAIQLITLAHRALIFFCRLPFYFCITVPGRKAWAHMELLPAWNNLVGGR
jgi:hypothetical protein